MPLEIERRFLVAGKEWKNLIRSSYHIQQGYLATESEGWTIRIRIINNTQSLITLKTPAAGIARHEYEYPIPLKDAEQIYQLTNFKIAKTRYELTINGQAWVIDSFEEENRPLLIAEVELNQQNQVFQKPSWCYKEITALKTLSNAALAIAPLTALPIEKRLMD